MGRKNPKVYKVRFREKDGPPRASLFLSSKPRKVSRKQKNGRVYSVRKVGIEEIQRIYECCPFDLGLK